MADVGIKELLEAGVHFGHQTRRWDPSMRRYIHGERDGIHVIDLLQTERLLAEATEFASELAGRGGRILFVGTKKQARDSIENWATRSGMPYVSRRWLGGLLTNFNTISKRIKRLHELNELKDEGQLELLPTKEQMAMEAELAKLEYNLGGVRDMQRVPDAVVVIDLNNEEIAVAEATRLGIPIIGLVDTNCDPGPVDYVIPGNDDAIRSCELIVGTLGDAILSSASAWQKAEEERRRREEEERKRREAEAKAKAEAEAKAKAEAEAKAKAEAEAKASAEAPEGAKQGGAAAAAQPETKKPGGEPKPKQRKPKAKAGEKPVPVARQQAGPPKPEPAAQQAEPTSEGAGSDGAETTESDKDEAESK